MMHLPLVALDGLGNVAGIILDHIQTQSVETDAEQIGPVQIAHIEGEEPLIPII